MGFNWAFKGLNGLHLKHRHKTFKTHLTFADDVVVSALPDYNLL
jgi:hypothetical protein